MNAFEPFILHTCEGLAGGKDRVRGYEPTQGPPFSPFEIDDPFGLRNAIVPVFGQDVDGKMYGVGTAFHVDGFGNFLTAYHVIDFIEKHPVGRPVLFLSMHGVVFGTVNIPPDCFVPAQEVVASIMETDDPMAALRGQSTRQPAIDVALLKAGSIGPGVRPPQTLPMRAKGWVPEVGEIVLAVGFPELNLSEVDQVRQFALLTEGMCGAYGRVVGVHEHGTSRTNPTPVFEVEGDWAPGMSGGPVFNRNGEVVGMVSRSMRAESDHPGAGFAVYFGLARDIEQLTPNVDWLNPGWRRCWGMFTSGAATPIVMSATKEAAMLAASTLDGVIDIRPIAHRIGTADFVGLND
ncbi:MAG: S1 family peptidase [Arenimonas sp.]